MTRAGLNSTSSTATVILALIVCSALVVVPGSAATKYLGGAPSFSASVSGINEFTPGEDATISILVKNSGLNQAKQLDRGTIEPELPTTAKTVTIGLASASNAVIVKSDPQMVGDIPGNGNSVTVKFRVKISSNATAGEYQLPLTISYRYPRVMDQQAADVFEFTYHDAEDILPVTLQIKPQVKVEVIEAVPENLSAGSDGYIHLKIKNAGPENGEMAVVKLLRNGQSPIIPSDSSMFIGALPSGGTVEGRYKVSASSDATNQTYPVDVVISYTNREGSIVSSQPETLGVPVMAKSTFTVTSSVPEVPAGAARTIEVRYRNDGAVPVFNSQAQITPHSPLVIGDNTAFLGDLKPGESAVAVYEIQAVSDAAAMVYSFDSTIRYRDALGTSHGSDTIPVQVRVLPAASGIAAIPGGLPVLAGCVIAVICIAFLVYRRRQENQ
jgi:hypothetical protein